MTAMNARPAHPAREPLAWIGLAGVGPDDSAAARLWQQRLHWPMVGIALLSLPAYILDTSDLSAGWHRIATVIDAAVFLAFALELAWMLSVTRQPFRYLVGNWLNLVVLLGTGAALFGAASEAVALIRVARIATAGFILLRAVAELRVLFTRRGAPLLFGAAFLSILTGGTLFYALDPKIHTVWDGMWLAFVTGATVGYGDLVPTTGATRVVAVFVVLAGWALLSLFTANIVAMFVSREETELRAELHREIVSLRADIARLLDAEEIRLRNEMRDEMRELRGALVRLAAAMEAREKQARDDRSR
jgi:voltage-gated potassium channel